MFIFGPQDYSIIIHFFFFILSCTHCAANTSLLNFDFVFLDNLASREKVYAVG
jgi:hypothetical protein